MALNDAVIRTFQADSRPYKKSDGGGLFLLIKPNGTRSWRMKYTLAGKEKLLTFGDYPKLSLAAARKKREEARHLLNQGIDPSEEKKQQKRQEKLDTANSFEAIAREWHEARIPVLSEKYASDIMARLEQNIFPKLGGRDIKEIEAPELLEVIRGVSNRGANHLAERLLQMSGQIFRYAIATGRASVDVSAFLKGSLPPSKVKHHAHMKENELPDFFKNLDAYDGSRITRLALEFVILTMARTGEVRFSSWGEIDFDKKLWSIPAERMKMRRDHLVPLSGQALNILEEMQSMGFNMPHI